MVNWLLVVLMLMIGILVLGGRLFCIWFILVLILDRVWLVL